MNSHSKIYAQWVKWVQVDMNKDRELVNRKVFSVVLWCLILPAVLSLLVFALRRFQIVAPMRFLDALLFIPPFAYTLYALWPTFKNLPSVFKKGGMGAILDESAHEVKWTEETALRINQEIRVTKSEWEIVRFHLVHELERLEAQNRYMTILSTVVLYFMFQFLDLGVDVELPVEQGVAGTMKMWVDAFSQWGLQLFSLVLFGALFYLSGLQFQRYLRKYLVCIERILKES